MLRNVCLSLVCFATTILAAKYDIPVQEKKVLSLTVSEFSQVFMGRDTLMISDLPRELKNRFWKCYLGTGKMQDALELRYSGNVASPVRAAAIDAIRQGQEMGLKDICLEKHKQYYEDLNPRQKEKIKKQFPVLFQAGFE